MQERIKMLERRYNSFPAKFYWQGRIFEIEAVNECKTVTSRTDDSDSYHFWVRCNGQQLHLCEILSSGDWLLHHD